MLKTRSQGYEGSSGSGEGGGTAPGKVARTSRLPGPVQRKAAAPTPIVQAKPSDAFDHATSGAASPLPHLAQMQAAFGVDFSDVQAHVGSAPAQAGLDALDADAATAGRKVAFADASPSVELVAHEAAHLVQTRGGTTGGGELSEPGDRAEREADAAADAVVAGQTPTVGAATSAGIHRSKRSKKAGRIIGAILGGIGGAIGGFLLGGPVGAVVGAVGGAVVGGLAGGAIGDAVGTFTQDEQDVARALAQREGRPNDWQQFQEQARTQLGTAQEAEGMEDDLNWNNQDVTLQNTAFGTWLLANGPEPDAATGQMNCWEMVMFSAYRAGFTSKAKLTRLYTQFQTDLGVDVDTGITAFENALRSGTEFAYDPNDPNSPKPVAGDLVIFNNLGAHVAVATGNQPGGQIEIMSLWTQNGAHNFRTTVETLLGPPHNAGGPVRFFSPAW